MKKILTILAFAFLFYSNLDAKQPSTAPKRRCGSDAPSVESEIRFQEKIQQFLAQQNSGNRLLANYTIPVVVHVVYWNAAENISAAQVNSQLDILNADYAGTGLNVNTCPAAFQSLISNTNITFCKAAIKPNGTAMSEVGIDRINAQTAGFTNPGTGAGSGWVKSYIDGTIKPATIWDPTKYMNVWVLPLEDGLLGYATFPTGTGLTGITGNGTATTDGVVIGYLYYGNTGTATASAPYNKGRTATHEVGHWLGLRHISGDSECGSDFCADTPPQRGNAGDGQGLNYGCPTFPNQPNSCTGTGANGELFQDFMDYTDDACMFLFTPDQRTRIQTAMANGTYRAPLAVSNVCTVTPTAPVANFSADRVSVCPGSIVKFTDLSSGAPTSWSWSFAGGTPATSTAQNPTVQYNSSGTYTVTLTASNTLGSDGETKTSYITVGNPTTTALPIVQGFESATFPPTGWSLVSASTFNWERTTLASGFGTSAASMRFNNTDNDASGFKDDIYSPTVIFPTGTTTARIKFDVAYAPYTDAFGQENDTMEVIAYDVCAGTYTSIYKKGGNQLATAPAQGNAFVPTAAQWRKDSVTLSASLINKNIKFIFRNYGLYGQSIYVDNINIYGSTATTTPTASFTASDTTVCKGNNLTFTSTSTSGNASAVDSVRWTLNGGTPSTSSLSAPSVTFNTIGTFNITLVAYEGGVASAPVTKSIRVKALPTVAAITGAATVCIGSSTTFSSTTAGGVWSSGGTGIATVTSGGVVNGISAGSVEILYTVTSGGCSTTVIKIITVNPLPTVSAITGTASICIGATTPYVSATSGGIWSSSATGIATVNASGVVTGVSTGTAEIRYTVTSGGCSTTVTKLVTVKDQPIANAGLDKVLTCANASATLGTSPVSGYTYSWSPSAGLSSTTIAQPTVSQAGTYTLTATSNGCSATDVIVVTTDKIPPVANAGIDKSLTCTLNTVSIGSAAVAGNTYAWTPAAGLSSTTIAQPNATQAGGFILTVTKTSNGCIAKDTVIITLDNIKPTVVVNNPTICSGQTATLTATGASTYAWNPNIGSTATVTTPVLTTTTTYVVTGTKASNGCTNSATATVTISSTPPTVVISPRDQSVCLGDAVTFSVSGANTYIWIPGNSTGNSFTFTPTGNTKVKVQGIAGACSNPGYDSVNVTIKSKPTISVNSPTICAGNTAILQANGASTYSWLPGGSTANPYTTSVLNSNTSYTVTGTSNGCSNTAVSTITVTPLPATPTITRRNDTLFSSVTGTQYKWYLNNVLLTTTTVPNLKVTQNGTYKVEVVSGLCTSLASGTINVSLTGVKYNNKLDIQFSILPNPNNGLFEIRITSLTNKTYQLKLFNVSGQIISAEEMNIRVGENSKNMNLFGIEKGVYFLSIIGEDGVATQSILVQ
jgi:PKD repeat protein